MTIEQIDRMVRGANPVPDLKALEPVDLSDLRVTQQRSGDMQTQDRIETDHQSESGRRRLLIGAAAVVLLLIGALIIFQSRQEAPVVTQAPEDPTAAVETATAFLDAYRAFDLEQAAAYLTADANLSGLWGGQEDWRLANSFMEAAGVKLLLDSCEAGDSTAAGTEVRCSYAYHAIRSDEIGLGPFSGSWFFLTVQEGKIVSALMSHEFRANGFSAQMWEPFAMWVAENHPEDAAIMYEDWPTATQEALTDESIALWEQHSQEYADDVRQG
jgi:hypothetical protein